MSGGVDSSVAAALLQRDGWEVIGVTMKVWPQDCISRAEEFHQLRDRMNAAGHLARETRYSPLTTTLTATHDRVSAIIEGPTL